MKSERRFPPPSTVEDAPLSSSSIWYGEGVARRSIAGLLTRNAARRIAVGIAN